jgi:hypothetical protein
MGMYDTIKINKNILPLSDEEKNKIPDNVEWQTKSFDNELTEIYITDDGKLKINRFEYEVVPKEERPNPNAEGLLGLAGSLRRINERIETLDYHGICEFYTYFEEQYYTFKAKFTDGKLQNIERVKDEQQ